VKAGVSSPPAAAVARADRLGGGAVATGGEVWATGIAVVAPYDVAPGTVPTAGPLVAPTAPGGAVWFCLTRSSRPISANAGRHKAVKWYLASTAFWLTPWADRTVGQVGSGALGGWVR
jgi:hypothetical protein